MRLSGSPIECLLNYCYLLTSNWSGPLSSRCRVWRRPSTAPYQAYPCWVLKWRSLTLRGWAGCTNCDPSQISTETQTVFLRSRRSIRVDHRWLDWALFCCPKGQGHLRSRTHEASNLISSESDQCCLTRGDPFHLRRVGAENPCSLSLYSSRWSRCGNYVIDGLIERFASSGALFACF